MKRSFPILGNVLVIIHLIRIKKRFPHETLSLVRIPRASFRFSASLLVRISFIFKSNFSFPHGIFMLSIRLPDVESLHIDFNTFDMINNCWTCVRWLFFYCVPARTIYILFWLAHQCCADNQMSEKRLIFKRGLSQLTGRYKT